MRHIPEEIEESFSVARTFLPQTPSGIKESKFDNDNEVVQQLISIIRQKNYSPRTLEAYCKWTRDFLDFKSCEVTEISYSIAKKFLNQLVIVKNVSPSAYNQAFNALLFLFRYVFRKEFGDHSGNIKTEVLSKKIPVVLSKTELEAVLLKIPRDYVIHFNLLYGCGLRVSDLLTIRLKDIDFGNDRVIIEASKGLKNRIIPLPQKIKSDLLLQRNYVIDMHNKNCISKKSYKGVFLPKSVSAKNAFLDEWLWLFPATKLTTEKESGYLKQFHLHDTVLGKVLREAVKESGIVKRITPHTFRHSYATHLLLNGFDIKTIQELMGHNDIKTTMGYLQVIKDLSPKRPVSPLDLVWD